MKYIVVTGGVVSGLGKGITISSLGRILKSCGVKVTSVKIDPYLNVDAGTMSPFEHGETFVLDDGSETDLDLGNYERFLDITLSGRHNITTGKIYKEVINQERRGDYLGKTVQIVPHATDMVQKWIKDVAKCQVDGSGREPDVCLIEVGGTVGDIESAVFLEALRQFQFSVGRDNILFIHISLVPVLGSVGEQKTKPTQHSVKELMSVGISPDIIVCRSTSLLSQSTKTKISQFCHVSPANVLSVHDVSNIYHVPLILAEQGIHTIVKKRLQLESLMSDEPDLKQWTAMAHIVDSPSMVVDIALVGKYTDLQDSYLSVTKALIHAAIHLNIEVAVKWIEASDLEEGTKATMPQKYTDAWNVLKSANGILVPGGFGVRGVEGKVAATRYARENKIPFLGVCLGMQVMVIEYVRNILGKVDANSAEFDTNTRTPAIIFMPEINTEIKGGTMRLGSRATLISRSYTTQGQGEVGGATSSLATLVYGGQTVSDRGSSESSSFAVMERHRHRYEVNPQLVSKIEAAGLLFTGRDDQGERMEIAELPQTSHPFYLGTQFHPEFKSRPNRPSPPFFAFVSVAAGKADQLPKAGVMWQSHEVDLNPVGEKVGGGGGGGPLSPRKRKLSEGLPTPCIGGSLVTSSSLPNSPHEK